MSELLPVPHPRFQDRHGNVWYQWKGTAVLPQVADMYSDMKRLTDEELAAEYYRFLHENSLIENDGYDGMPETRAHRSQAAALHRFATLPHYDQPQPAPYEQETP